MNCNYWDERYPRLVTKDQLRKMWSGDTPPRLRVIGDLGCDIEGAVECTLKCTEPSDPIYVYDPIEGTISSGVDGSGPVVLAVDILPAELPREASEEFSSTLAPFLPALAQADFDVPFSELALPPELLGAVIAHRGELTPDYAYIEEHLETRQGLICSSEHDRVSGVPSAHRPPRHAKAARAATDIVLAVAGSSGFPRPIFYP